MVNSVLDYLLSPHLPTLATISISLTPALIVPQSFERMFLRTILLHFVQDLVAEAAVKIHFVIFWHLDCLCAVPGLVGQVFGCAVLWYIFSCFEIINMIILTLILFYFVKFGEVLLSFHLLLGHVRKHV